MTMTPIKNSHTYFVDGGRQGIRTPDPRLRRPVLYPSELTARLFFIYYIFAINSSFISGMPMVAGEDSIFRKTGDDSSHR